MSVSDAPAAEGDRQRGGASLPPVAPPTATFILQLFLIPLLIVTIVVVLWLLFSWVAHMGRDNASDLAKAIIRDDTASWQRAYELADLLHSPDPRYAGLRKDTELAGALASFLERDLKQPLEPQESRAKGAIRSGTYSGSQAPQGSDRRARIMRRMYLCRSLGSFAVTDGLPVLIKAATQEEDPVEVQVRFSALEAISTLADNCGAQTVRDNKDAMQAILDASRVADDTALPPPVPTDGEPTLYRPHAELRAVAAYALGVIGGDEATERLEQMLHDTYPNARFNAATGLARRGSAKCERVLREMLDPANPLAVKDEINPNDQARKRITVLLNGISGTVHLAESNPGADLTALKKAIEKLASGPLDEVTVDRNKVKNAATEALRLLSSKVPSERRQAE
jgi:hypothetical protein